MHLFLSCSLHFLRIFHVAGQKDKSSVVVMLRNQKSEPNKVVIMRFVAVAMKSWLFIELFVNLMRDGGE